MNNIVNGGGIKYFHANSTLADSTATGTNAVSIGGAATASAANSVALGSNSVANRANAVSVGAVGTERQIINVANGTSGTDAINLSQLQAMGATIGTSGVVTNAFVSYDDTSKTKVTFGGVGAQKPVTLTNVAAGVANTDAVNMAQLKELGASIDGSGNVSGSFVAYDDTSLGSITLKGASGTKISDVAAGTLSAGSMDAVNGSQLYATNQNVANVTNIVNNMASGASLAYFKANGANDGSDNAVAPNTGSIAIGAKAAVAASAGVDQIAIGHNAQAGTAGWTGAIALGGSTSALYDGIAAGNAASATASGSVALGGNAKATASSSTALGKGSNATATNSVALGANSVASRANAVSVGGVGSERQIVNVANGTSGTDAVNLSQLAAMGATIGTSGVVTNSFVAYDDTSLASITLKGANGTKITNVAAGALSAASMDAVNGSQLFSTNQNVANVAGNVTNLAGNVTTP